MKENVVISTDKSLLNRDLIHQYLKESYWAKNIPIETVNKSIDNSLCFGIYEKESQVGFARVITDYTTFAYVGDVFIVSEKQGNGLGEKLMNFILKFPELKGLRRWHLVTLDAQELYKKVDFSPVEYPEQHMEIKGLCRYEPKDTYND